MRTNYLIFPAILFLFLSYLDTSAQENRLDSLNSILPKTKGSKRMDLLIQLGLAFVDRDNRKSLANLEEAHVIARKYGDSAMIVKTGRMVGQLYIRVDSISKAIAIHSEMLEVAERNHFNTEYHRIANSLAAAFTWEGNYLEALRYNSIALTASEAAGDKEAVGVSMNNIGLTYLKMENYDAALQFFTRSINYQKDIQSPSDVSRMYFNAGICYTLLKRYDLAYKSITTGFIECGNQCDDFITNEGLLALGLYYKELNKFDQAEDSFKKSLAIARKVGNRKYQIENLKSLARISLTKNNLKDAYAYLSGAEETMRRTSYENMKAEVYRDFAEYYRITGNYQTAATYYNRFVVLSDSLFKQKISEINKMRTDFEQRENRKTISAQNEILRLKDDALESRTYLILLLSIIALLLFTIIFIMARHNRRKTEMNVLLDQRVKERTTALDTSYHELLRISLQQQSFLGKAFSELNGHLNTIKGLLNLLAIAPADRDNVVESTDMLLSASRQLSATIEKLRTNSDIRIGAGNQM